MYTVYFIVLLKQILKRHATLVLIGNEKALRSYPRAFFINHPIFRIRF
jgi:hypothetical protein